MPLVGHPSHPYYTERDKEVSKKTMIWFSNYVKYGYVLYNDYINCYKRTEIKLSYPHNKVVMYRVMKYAQTMVVSTDWINYYHWIMIYEHSTILVS